MRGTRKHSALLYIALGATLLISGCGGGGGGGTGVASAPPGGGANATSTFLFYSYADSAGTTTVLNAVNPANPSSPTNVYVAVGSTFDTANVVEGTYSGGVLSDRHNYALVFSDGYRLYSVSAATASGTPLPSQISSASFSPGSTTAFCDFDNVFADYANPANSVIVYHTAGADATCNTQDDPLMATLLSASYTTAPVQKYSGGTGSRAKSLMVARDTTGAITSMLAWDGSGDLDQYISPFWTGNTWIYPGYNAAVPPQLYSVDATGKTLLGAALGTSSTMQIVVWKPTATGGSLSTPGGTPYSLYTTRHFLTDGTNAYFFGGSTPDVLYRMPMDGSATPTIVYNAPNGVTIGNNWMMTTHRIVFTWSDGTNNGVDSVLKSATGATSATSLLSTASEPVATATYVLHSAHGAGVNYTDNLNLVAYHVNEDGSGLRQYGTAGTSPSAWVGHSEPSKETAGVYDGSFSLRSYLFTSNSTANYLDAYDDNTGMRTARMLTDSSFTYLPNLGGAYLANNYHMIYTLNNGTSDIPFLMNTNASNSAVQLPMTSTGTASFTGVGGCSIGTGTDVMLPLLLLAALGHFLRRRFHGRRRRPDMA